MKVALLCDSPDEKWPSMDLVGQLHAAQLSAQGVPHHVFAPPISLRTPSFALDRLLFRFADYPLLAKRLKFDVFHIVDHSYSQLVHSLPPGRAVVTCHDLDTFRSLLEPARDPRGVAFQMMTKHILNGFRKAAQVACDSVATFEEIRRFDLIPADRLSVVPLAVHPSCSPEPDVAADREAARLLNNYQGPALLHVGSTLPRKRIDLLLRIFAGAQLQLPDLRLIRVGGLLTRPQTDLARSLNLENLIVQLPFLDRAVLAAIYRRATLVLQPSDSEGFGLPVAEAMACGTPVLASDLAVLREVGGEAAVYCPAGDSKSWIAAVELLLKSPLDPIRQLSLAQAAKFSVFNYTNRMLEVYNKVLNP